MSLAAEYSDLPPDSRQTLAASRRAALRHEVDDSRGSRHGGGSNNGLSGAVTRAVRGADGSAVSCGVLCTYIPMGATENG